MSTFTKVPIWNPNAKLPLADAIKDDAVNKSFNVEQEKALEVLTGRHVINAGAGTGKTTCLVARTRKILETYPESRVLLISFTKKAAEEIRQRIGSTPKVEVSTFHSLSYKILRSTGVNYQVTTSETMQEAIISKIIGLRNTTTDEVKKSLRQIEVPDVETKAVRDEYLTYLQEHQQTTFDTMQIFALRLLQENEAVLRAWQERVDYYLVDEFQDIDFLQCRLIHLLAQRTGNLTVAGDRRQSIYSFRGSVPDAIGKFAESAVHYDLTVNYRCNRAVLGLGNRIMAKEKPLLAAVNNPTPIWPRYLMAADMKDEAKAVVNEIVALHKAGTEYKDMVILFRSCSASASIVQELLRRKIPAISKGTVTLTHTKPPYCGIIRLFRFMLNPDDKELFKAIMPVLYLRKGLLKEVVALSVKNGCTLMEAAQKLDIPHFHKGYIEELSEAITAATKMRPSEAALHLLNHGYGQYIGPEMTESVRNMANNLNDYPSITAYLNFIDDLQEQAEEMKKLTATSTDYIQLMTIHAAKGKEWNTVFLIGVQDGVLPSAHEGTDLEEERRLLYVAVTRAKERLYISYPRLSEKHSEPNEVSRFLREIF